METYVEREFPYNYIQDKRFHIGANCVNCSTLIPSFLEAKDYEYRYLSGIYANYNFKLCVENGTTYMLHITNSCKNDRRQYFTELLEDRKRIAKSNSGYGTDVIGKLAEYYIETKGESYGKS